MPAAAGTTDSAHPSRSPEAAGDSLGRALSAAVEHRANGAVLQRTVAEDVDTGWKAVKTATQYQRQVAGQLPSYTDSILRLDNDVDPVLKGYAQQMAAGFAVWGENYYNKTQAYLWESELAAQHSAPYGNPRVFGILGVSTDENPDLTLIRQSPTPHLPATMLTEQHAVEVKASTSDRYASFDGLVANGMAQLAKRQNNVPGTTHLQLRLHNDATANHWPFTDWDFQHRYNNDFTQISSNDWNSRLATRVTALKNTKGIQLPVLVEALYAGNVYARANV